MSRFLWIKNTQNFHITKSNNNKKKVSQNFHTSPKTKNESTTYIISIF